jgi:glycerol-1-phosphate dehydrogenase [NAD(P)+]
MENDRIRPRLQSLLRLHGERRGARLRLLDTLAEAVADMADTLPEGRLAVVCDPTTLELAGRRLATSLSSPETIVIDGRHGQPPKAGIPEVEELRRRLQRAGVAGVAAVGAGTINDLTKAACHRLDLPYAVLATAPSMNGYTSAAAALLDDGVKTTVPCRPPVAVLAPIDLLRAAPAAMIQAGFGDLRSRPVSGADWYLGHRLLDTPYTAEALELADIAEGLTSSTAAALARGDAEAVARLGAALLLSGLAMDVAGTSAPSSGGEHLVSHYLDMSHFCHGTPHGLHGCQVGVATLATATLYERLLALEPDDIRRSTSLAPWASVAAGLQSHFGPLWPHLRDTALAVHGDETAVEARVQRLRQDWPETRARLSGILSPAATLRAELSQAGAPVRFSDLGVDRGLARSALIYGRYVRGRYTLLDLAAELGRLQEWSAHALDATA